MQFSIDRRHKMLSFGKHVCGLLTNTMHGLFVVDPEDSTTTVTLLNDGCYNVHEYQKLQAFVSEGSNVLVVGAHIGSHVVPLSRMCENLVAIEANPRTFAYLQANLRLNGCANVVAHNLAAGDKSEKIEFLACSVNSGGSKRMPLIVHPHYVYDHPNIVTVDSVPLDLLIDHRSFDLVLMDIEGSEFFALKGMPEILAGTKVLSVEFLPHHLDNVASVSVEEFLAPILPHFNWLWVSEDDEVFAISDAVKTCRAMYEKERFSDGLFFLKELPDWLREPAPHRMPRHDIDLKQTVYDYGGYLQIVPFGEEPPSVGSPLKSYCELARDYVEAGDPRSAKACYQKVLGLSDPPDTPMKRIARNEACKFMAMEAHETNNLGTAVDWWHKALVADPLDVQGRIDYIFKALLPMKWTEVARIEAERACTIEPDDPMVWQCAAAVEREAGDFSAMDRMVAKALELGPDNAGSNLIAALCCADTCRFEEAEAHYRRVIELAPHRRAEAIHGLGIVLDREGRTEEGLALLDEALSMWEGDETTLRWNRAEMLLTLGRYAEGWRDHSIRSDERHHRGRDLSAFGRLAKRFTTPVLSLEDGPCRVHVHPEMGAGDTFCMLRYLPLLVDMGHDVRLEVSTNMVDLLTRSFPDVKVRKQALDYPGALGLAEFDRHATTMMFPHIFGTALDTIPWSGPYIKADPALAQRWHEKLPASFYHWSTVNRPKVGLCWSAGIRPGPWYTEYGQRKSMRFTELAPLLKADANFVSLQAGRERLENLILPGLEEEKPSWSDTAALIANLDLVVTVDTSIAHLAGAMGKPVWLMMHTQGSWHWMRDRTDSPWYPSVRIFRQERPHEWGLVVEAVRDALCRLVV